MNRSDRFGFEGVKLGVGHLDVLSLFELVSAYKVGALNDDIAHRAKVTIANMRAALACSRLKETRVS